MLVWGKPNAAHNAEWRDIDPSYCLRCHKNYAHKVEASPEKDCWHCHECQEKEHGERYRPSNGRRRAQYKNQVTRSEQYPSDLTNDYLYQCSPTDDDAINGAWAEVREGRNAIVHLIDLVSQQQHQDRAVARWRLNEEMYPLHWTP